MNIYCVPVGIIHNHYASAETEFQGKEVACPWPHNWQLISEHVCLALMLGFLLQWQYVNEEINAYNILRTMPGMQCLFQVLWLSCPG